MAPFADFDNTAFCKTTAWLFLIFFHFLAPLIGRYFNINIRFISGSSLMTFCLPRRYPPKSKKVFPKSGKCFHHVIDFRRGYGKFLYDFAPRKHFLSERMAIQETSRGLGRIVEGLRASSSSPASENVYPSQLSIFSPFFVLFPFSPS